MKNMEILTQIKTEESWWRKTPRTMMMRNSTDGDGETRTQLTFFTKSNGAQRENGAIRNVDGTKC